MLHSGHINSILFSLLLGENIKFFSSSYKGQCLLRLLVLVWRTLSTSCIKSLVIVSLNSQCNHFESQLVRMIKLLRMLGSRRWKNIFFGPFLGLTPKGMRVHRVVTSIPVPLYLLWPCTVGNLIGFRCSLQKLPSAGGQCMFISICASYFSFHTVAVKLPLTLLFMSPCFCFIFHPKVISILFLFGLTVP